MRPGKAESRQGGKARASLRRAGYGGVLRTPALLPHRGSEAGRNGGSGRHGVRQGHEPAPSGRCGQRQNPVRGCPGLGSTPERIYDRLYGADGDSGGAALQNADRPARAAGNAGGEADGGHDRAREARREARPGGRGDRPAGGNPRPLHR